MFDLPWLGPESRVVFGGEIQYDNVRDTQATGLVQVRVPLGRLFSRGRRLSPLQRRMVEPIVRDIDVVTNSTPSTAQTQTVLTDGGNPITLTHIDSNAGGANLGTFENPFTILPVTQGSNIVYVHADSVYNNQSYVLNANQRLLGEGNGNQHSVNTDQLGMINLPAGNGGTNRPVIQNVQGVALDVANVSEISNFAITGAGTAARLNGLTGNVNLNRTLISGGATGIDILGGSGTFTDVTIEDSSTAGIDITGGSSTVNFGGPNNPGAGQFGPSTIDQNTNGSTVAVSGGHSGSFTQDAGSGIIATNGDGLQFNGADGNYNFNGPVTLNGGNAGIDILGGSAGSFTFSNTTITDPTGIGLNVDGGSADVTFESGSSITQNTYNQPLIDMMGGHTGTVTFDLGTNLEATNGTGLQFMDADGTYNFNGDITLDGTSNSADTGIDIISDSAGTFTFAGTFANPNEITNDQGVAVNMDSSPGSATFSDLRINQSVGAGVRANNSGSLTLDIVDIDNTTGDGINVTNTNLTVNLVQIGLNTGIGDDGIEVVNSDGTDRTATILGNNIFPLAGTGIANRGIYISSSGTGTLEADVRFNFIDSTNQTILTTSGPTAGSLILDLQNSTLTTNTPGVFTEEHVGGGLNSTIVRSWDSPNQVIGAIISGTGGGGIRFDQVTFDADGDPSNGYQQVPFTGDLDIGSAPPQTIARVTGDGLSFINPTGVLSIETLYVASFNGTGLEVDASGGTVFDLSVGGGTIDTSGGDAIVLNGVNNFSLNNSTVNNGAAFDTLNAASSNLSGTGNTAPTLNCTDGGGNTGSITINGTSCP